jgi:hypothetical protein
MGTSLTGLTPSTTYDGLIKLSDNQPLEATAKYIGDGLGNDSVLSLSTTKVGIGTSTPTATLQVKGSGTTSATKSLITTTSTGNETLSLTDSGYLNLTSNSSGTGILFYNVGGSYNTITASANFRIHNNTNGNPPSNIGLFQNGQNLIGINTNSQTASLHIQGSGSTSATTSLLVQNSAASELFKLLDDGSVSFGTKVSISTVGTINAAGNLYALGGSSVQVTAAGNFRFVVGSVISNSSDGVLMLSDWALSTFNRLQLGGTTSAFPSIKRNGTAIDIRLADDSNYAALNTGATLIKGSGSTSATTSLLVQNSSGTAALTVKDDGNIYLGGAAAQPYFTSTSEGNNRLGINGFTNFYQPTNFSNSLVVSSTAFSNATTSSIVDIQSTTKGFLPPRMTTTQKNAIATPAAGLMVYDTTLAKLCVYTTAWETITSV